MTRPVPSGSPFPGVSFRPESFAETTGLIAALAVAITATAATKSATVVSSLSMETPFAGGRD
jgi:hypothetical protein